MHSVAPAVGAGGLEVARGLASEATHLPACLFKETNRPARCSQVRSSQARRSQVRWETRMARLLSTWFVYLVVYVPVLAAPVALMGTPHRNWRGFDTLMFI